jgi:hypothetical protein
MRWALGALLAAGLATFALAQEPRPSQAPDLDALAESFLADYLLADLITGQRRREITRPAPNTVRFVRMSSGTHVVTDVEARSCTELIERHGVVGARQFDTESTHDLLARGRITLREGANIRLLPGVYGRQVDHRVNATIQLDQSGGLIQARTRWHDGYDRLLRVIGRFCGGVPTPARPG